MLVSTPIIALLLVISMPTLLFSVQSSQKLMKYENLTKKAAKLSDEAGRQLRKTRTTQSSAIFAALWSTFSAAYGLQIHTPSWLLCGENVALCLAVNVYLGNFWSGSMRAIVPGAREYNDAVRMTEWVLVLLKLLAGVWAVAGVVSLMFG